MMRVQPGAVLLWGLLAAAAPAASQDAPVQAGSGGVPIPKRTKTVKPEYPAEAQARGVGGIVILELVIDTAGKVAAVQVIRSVPPFDEAAVTAARQWEYEVIKMNGKPVSVRLTVPISFLVKLPEIKRQAGIPELRQGASPVFPPDAHESASVTAELTLDADGQVADAQVVTGTMPWSAALEQALRTWRFATDGTNAIVSFRVEADFVAGSKGNPPRVDLRLTGLRRSESLPPGQASPPAAPPASAAVPGEVAAAPAAGAAGPLASPAPSPAPVTSGEAGAAAKAAPTAGPSPGPSPAAPAPEPSPVPRPSPAAGSPSTETMTAPPPDTPPGAATPAPVTESGVSAIRDVVLSEGVPDLAKGRRPSPPPLARMAGASDTVEVRFAVNAAGITTVQSVTGPDILKPSAEQTAASWVFRRTSAMRLHLLAVFTYSRDAASAAVRPE
ncbi:MAG TPA: TonB family protein [Vicinamibacteria bacterium]|jgi:TonB family protein|nr:TonB family protein [Vicinamibacteria bacterium]